MADKQIIDAMWDDSPVDVSTEVKILSGPSQTNCADRTVATNIRMSLFR